MSELRFLDPESVKATLPNNASEPRIEIRDDRTILQAQVRRAFPLSATERHLSIADAAGVEVGILRSLEGVEPETKAILSTYLDRRYFSPIIQRIVSLKHDAAMWKFAVETQRGTAEFYVRNWRDSAHEVAVGRWMIQSVDGQRYEILDLEALDHRSQNLLDAVF